MKTITLNKNELEVLKILLDNSITACRSGCVYPEIQDSRIECNECKYTKGIESLMNKIAIK